MRSDSKCAVRYAVSLLAMLAGACVEDVWLGAEPSAADAPSPTDKDAAEPADANAGAAPDARPVQEDAAVALPPDDAPESEGDAGPPPSPFCGITDCAPMGFSPDTECVPSICQPTPEGGCVKQCDPALRCGRDQDAPCPGDTYCNLGLVQSQCNERGEGGFCTPYALIASCSRAPQSPVCGCDGREYASECEAATRGMSVRKKARCE